MTTPNELLVASLETRNTAQSGGTVRSEAISRTHLNRLVQAGFLKSIFKRWYYVVNLSETVGSMTWFNIYWSFIRQNLTVRFQSDYCLTDRPFLLFHTGLTIPAQLSIIRAESGNQKIQFQANTSLFIYQDTTNFSAQRVKLQGLQCRELTVALLRVPESFFQKHPDDATIALQWCETLALFYRRNTVAEADLLKTDWSACKDLL